MKPFRWVAIFCLLWPVIANAAESYNPASTPPSVRFESHEIFNRPVIDADHPDARGNKYGFEGGTVVKIDGTYHLFVAEMVGDPFWVKMRLAHWTSPDAKQWKRVSTLKETNGKRRAETGLPYESLWAPMPVYNDGDERWDLFSVAYDRGEGGGGRIWHAISTVAGRGGIGGPYQDVGIILQPDAQSQPWEGGQGTDSFFPYRVKDRWYAFYGSHKIQWEVGLAHSRALAGPWKRCAQGNPVPIETVFIENPIVTRIDDLYVAIYDCMTTGAATYKPDGSVVGFTSSTDGVHWSPGGRIVAQPPGVANWSKDIRTPLCLIDEGGGVYTMLYTGQDKHRRFWPVGMIRLKLVK